MAPTDDTEDRNDRIGRIHTIVQEDYDRITSTDDSYVVLNLKPGAPLDQVHARYERYERFYRAENFQRLGDMDLTRKALDIRRAIGRAMVEIQASVNEKNRDTLPALDEVADLPSVSADARAMGDIYFRDGLSYMCLGDFNAASEHFQRSMDYDPTRGITLANHAYTAFKLRPTDPRVIEDARAGLRRAAAMEPNNVEIFVLMARFAINTRQIDQAEEAVQRIAEIQPDDPRIAKLRQRAKKKSM
ncbi:MAG: tetratricopeptide repeat protein [Bradymonadaceae bacterium]